MFHGKRGKTSTTAQDGLLYEVIFNTLAYESNYNRCKQNF